MAEASLSNELAATLGTVVGTAFWIVFGYAVDCLMTVFVWYNRVQRRSGVPVSKSLTRLAGMAIWITTAIILLAVVYDVPIAGFSTTSGIIIAVIGFALRNLIADVFTRIALGIERPLQIGDWIKFDDERPGKVVEINWRAARLITMDEVSVVVPNSQLAAAVFRNYSQPNEYWWDEFEIVLPYDVTYRQAERILLSAVEQVPASASIPREPDLLIGNYSDRGTEWRVLFWVPDYPRMAVTRYKVQRNVLRNLYYAGIDVPHAKMGLFSPRRLAARHDEEREDIDFLHGITPLAHLTTEELDEIAKKMRRHLFIAGQPVVREG